MGGALLVPGSLAIISAHFSDAERGRAIGTWSAATTITAALGPVLGGYLIEHASWRWVFFINAPLAALVLVLVIWGVPESRDPAAQRLDWLGALLGAAGLGALTYGLINAGAPTADPLRWGRRSPWRSYCWGCSCWWRRAAGSP